MCLPRYQSSPWWSVQHHPWKEEEQLPTTFLSHGLHSAPLSDLLKSHPRGNPRRALEEMRDSLHHTGSLSKLLCETDHIKTRECSPQRCDTRWTEWNLPRPPLLHSNRETRFLTLLRLPPPNRPISSQVELPSPSCGGAAFSPSDGWCCLVRPALSPPPLGGAGFTRISCSPLPSPAMPSL